MLEIDFMIDQLDKKVIILEQKIGIQSDNLTNESVKDINTDQNQNANV